MATDNLIIAFIWIISLYLVWYGWKGYKRREISVPSPGFKRSYSYSGSWAIAPSIFVIFAGLFAPFVSIGRLIDYLFELDSSIPIMILVWCILGFLSIFFFWIKEKKRA